MTESERRWKTFIEIYCWYMVETEKKERDQFRLHGHISLSFLKNNIGVVYLIRSDGAVKIGKTSNLKGRLSQFRTTLPNPFELVHTIESCDIAALEKALHDAYGDKNLHHEWFALDNNDIDEIVFFGSRLPKIEKRYYEERNASKLARTMELLSEMGE